MLLPSSHTSSLHSMPSNLSWWYSWGKETIWYLIVIMPLLRTAGLVAPAIGLHVPISGDRRISGVKLSPVSVRNWSHHRFDFRVRGETDGMMNETDPKGVRQHQANSMVEQPQSRSSQLSGFSRSNGLNVGAVSIENVSVAMDDVVRWARNTSAIVLNGTYSSRRGVISTPRRFNITTAGVTRNIRLAIPKEFSFLEPPDTWNIGSALNDLGGIIAPTSRFGAILIRLRRMQSKLEIWEEEASRGNDVSQILPATDLSKLDRKIWIITTAALPWMTGTSMNPLLRAAYLAGQRGKGFVTLMLPWLDEEKQGTLFGNKTFSTPSQQETYILNWLRDANLIHGANSLRIIWYPGRFVDKMGSIFPVEDVTSLIPDEEADVCILEEPEHLTWFRATGSNWSKKFSHVVGIIHTNYCYYASTARVNYALPGSLRRSWVWALNKLMARAYCDKIIKLSSTLQSFASEKETVCNVHGVRDIFLTVGDAIASGEDVVFTKGAYMLGKMMWEKGYDRLFELMMKENSASLDGCFVVDLYGSGPNEEEIKHCAKEMGLPISCFGAVDHATLSQYRVFVNPSVSEVLCTTIAEALAMGKWVVCAEHPSNEFFYQFSNCLVFKTSGEFKQAMNRALGEDPVPLPAEQRHMLSWEAATERLLNASSVTVGEARRRRRALDEMAYVFHYHLVLDNRWDIVSKLLQGRESSIRSNTVLDFVRGDK